jgi:hypothetical protein
MNHKEKIVRRLGGGPRTPGMRAGLIAVIVAIVVAAGLTAGAGSSSAEDTFCGNAVVEQGQGSWADQLNSEANLFYDQHIQEIAHAISQGQWVCVPIKWMISKSVEFIAGRGAQEVLGVKVPGFDMLVKIAHDLATGQQPTTLPAVGAEYLQAPVTSNGLRLRTTPVNGDPVGHFDQGDTLWIVCQSRAGDGTLWDQVATSPGGQPAGFVADRFVYTGTAEQVTASC